MLRFLLRRVVESLPTLLVVTAVVFLMTHLIPGDPARVLAGEYATDADVERVREDLGLDRPLAVQYFSYLRQLASGDLGDSLRTRRPVSLEIRERVGATLALATWGMLTASVAGIGIGVFAAYKRGGILDNLAIVTSLLGLCTPAFWLGLLLILAFAVNLQWLPAHGTGTPQHLILPVVTLAVAPTAVIARLTRTAMIDALAQDYIRTGRAKGLPARVVVFKHALRNAVLAPLTFIGVQFGIVLSGAVVTETVFSRSGLGRLAVTAILQRDLPLIQGLILVFALATLIINLVIDAMYSVVNPQVAQE